MIAGKRIDRFAKTTCRDIVNTWDKYQLLTA
jgi:hypothetical protein